MTAAVIAIDGLGSEAEDATGEDAFSVDLAGFEGPLHLLLDMARKRKVDLLQVSVLELANQYLDFIKAAKSKRIDLAADYLLMAAWLAYMKSRLLLPTPTVNDDDEPSGEEMAVRLAFRLKRLDAMRSAAEALSDGPVLGRSVFLRGEPEQPKVIRHLEYDTTVWHLTQAFGLIRSRREEDAPHQVEKQLILPLESARETLRSVAIGLDDWASLDEIRRAISVESIDAPASSVLASVFAASLELTRDGEVELRQDLHFAPLYLRRGENHITTTRATYEPS